MDPLKKAKVLRIYVSSTDKVKRTPVFESIAFSARRYGLAGTTVYKGVMGYGASSELHAPTSWEFMEKIPIIIEIIDDAEKIDDFLEKLIPWMKILPKGCLITCHETDIALVKQGEHE